MPDHDDQRHFETGDREQYAGASISAHGAVAPAHLQLAAARDQSAIDRRPGDPTAALPG